MILLWAFFRVNNSNYFSEYRSTPDPPSSTVSMKPKLRNWIKHFVSLGVLCGAACGGEMDASRLAQGREALRFAEAQIPRITPVTEQDAAWIELASAWGGTDPARGLDLFQRVKDTQQLEGVAIELCGLHARKLIADSGVPAALKTIQAIPFGSLRHLCWVAVGETWAQTDAKAAAVWARTLPREMDRDWTLYYVATGMSRKEPAAALGLAREIKDPFFLECLQRHILFELAAKDPREAWGKLGECPAGMRWQVAAEIGWCWARVDRAAALMAIEKLAPSREQSAAWSGVAAVDAEWDGKAASVALVKAEPTLAFLKNTERLIEAWAAKSPTEAMAWIEMQEHMDAEQRWLWKGTVLREASKRDPVEGQKMLARVGIKPSHWMACGDGFAQADAQGALAWAKGVSDPVRRIYALIGVARGAAAGRVAD